MTGLFLVVLTGPERDAALMALHVRQGQLDAVAHLAHEGSGARQAAMLSKQVATEAWEQVYRADETGVACSRCGRAVPPAASDPPYCAEACWTAAIAERRQ